MNINLSHTFIHNSRSRTKHQNKARMQLHICHTLGGCVGDYISNIMTTSNRAESEAGGAKHCRLDALFSYKLLHVTM